MSLLLSLLVTLFSISGHVLDPQGRPVAGAVVRVGNQETHSDAAGAYSMAVSPADCAAEGCILRLEAPGFTPLEARVGAAQPVAFDLRFQSVEARRESLVITARTLEPGIDLRNGEVYNRTLFTRDDQLLQQLDAGIDAGQHEGGGKSLEIRRFGFNLDHGGVNGGLKVMLDDVQQNQGTQGHGQGYLGSLKTVTPELIQDVTTINGPFDAQYGDFSGLGVVKIRQRELLPDDITVRAEAGSFDARRAFLAWSPDSRTIDSYIAYEGAYTNGPFVNPLHYRRDNLNASFAKSLPHGAKYGMRVIAGRNVFDSSGQLPLDLVSGGSLERFGAVDPSDGGRSWQGTVSGYYLKPFASGSTLRMDGFATRSLFDLFSNFTFYLHDPVHGDGIQQHDSRLQAGSNIQYTRPQQRGRVTGVLVAGGNLHQSDINVGLYPREARTPLGVTTRAHADVTNAAGYAQETLSFWNGRLIAGAGLRFDEFRYGVLEQVPLPGALLPGSVSTRLAGRWQGKGSLAVHPVHSDLVSFHLNYGRGVNSIDARGVVEHPEEPPLATTDFFQAGAAATAGRFSASVDAFLIDHSHELVYIPDDGSFEFKGPSRAYGYEARSSLRLTRSISLNGGLTKTLNAFYRGRDHRVYVDSAPHFVANAGIAVSAWRGWSGSVRMGAINHYRLDGEDPGIVASGHTVLDLAVARRLRHGAELNLSVDNLTNRAYYETQNFFVSQVTPVSAPIGRIHGTSGYPLSAMAGITFRIGTKAPKEGR